MAGVRILNVEKSFGSVKVIRNVDIEVRDGEFVVLVGPSGCGKSTEARQQALFVQTRLQRSQAGESPMAPRKFLKSLKTAMGASCQESAWIWAWRPFRVWRAPRNKASAALRG